MARDNLPAAPKPKQIAYSPIQTAEIRNKQISDFISSQRKTLGRHTNGIDLFNLEEVKQATDDYYDMCEETHTYPNFEGLCGEFGITREWAYKFIRTHPDHETAKFLDRLRTLFVAGKFALSETNQLNPVSVIFQTKNAGMGYTDKHEFDVISSLPDDERARRPEWAQDLTDDDYKERIVECVPIDIE